MTAQEKLLKDVVKSQEIMFESRFNSIVGHISEELKNLPFDNTDLDSMVVRLLPNVTVYIDYAIRGFSYRQIELDRVDILNIDDDHLPKAEKQLTSALQEIIYSINEEAEQYSEEYHETFSYA